MQYAIFFNDLLPYPGAYEDHPSPLIALQPPSCTTPAALTSHEQLLERHPERPRLTHDPQTCVEAQKHRLIIHGWSMLPRCS